MNELNYWSNKLCFHVIDYMDILDNPNDILERLNSILERWLLTADEQWRRKKWLECTSASRLDVFSTKIRWNMWNDPKIDLQTIVREYWTVVWIILEADHEDYGDYPHSLVLRWVKPEIKALVLDESSPLLLDLYYELINLSSRYSVLLLNRLLEPLEKPDWVE